MAAHELPVWITGPSPCGKSNVHTARNDSVLTSTRPSRKAEDGRSETDVLAQGLDKGHRALCKQVLAAHLVVFNSFGLIQSFGVLSSNYSTLLNASPAAVSWIGTIPICLAYIMGPLSTITLEHVDYRKLTMLGNACQIGGLLLASFSHTYWVVLASQGVLVGVGHGLTFTPTIARLAAVVCKNEWKMTALSIAGCGAATGGIVFAVVARYTVEKLGVGWMLRVVSAIVGVNATLTRILAQQSTKAIAVASGLTYQDQMPARRVRFEWGMLKERSTVLYSTAMLLVFAGLWIPYFYLRIFATDVLHLDTTQSFALLVVLHVAGIPGRIAPALLSDVTFGTLNTYISVLLLTSITLMCWPMVNTAGGMFVWTGGYGFCAGGAVSLVQAGAVSLCKDDADIARKIAVVFGVAGSASLGGAPVGGQLIKLGEGLVDDSGNAFLLLQLFTGGLMILGCTALVAARTAKTGWEIVVKI